MRNFIITLLFTVVTFTTMYSQHNMYVDPVLRPYVDEFIAEAEERGFDTTPYLNLVTAIYVNKEMRLYLMGLYVPKASEDGENFQASIQINPYCLVDSLMLRAVVFHELGHACGYTDHSCTRCYNILSQYAPKDFTYGIYYDDTVWDRFVDTMFDNIRNVPESENYVLQYIKYKNK